MAVHVLKVWAEPYNTLKDGRKTAEYRRDDRGFAVGDVLVLQPFDPDPPHGHGGAHVNLPALRADVTHIARGPHVPEGFAMLSLANVREATLEEDSAAMRVPGAYGPTIHRGRCGMMWGIFWRPRPDGPWVPWVDQLFPSRTTAWNFVDRDRNGADAGRPGQRRRTIARARKRGLRLCPASINADAPRLYLGDEHRG